MNATAEVAEEYCQWSHIIGYPAVGYIDEHAFWDGLKRPNTVVFPLRRVKADIVRNWMAETFDYQPRLSRIRLPVKKATPLLIGFRLEFDEFEDAVLCRLRWC